MGYKTEEKIINGIKITFNYKSSNFGIKKYSHIKKNILMIRLYQHTILIQVKYLVIMKKI